MLAKEILPLEVSGPNFATSSSAMRGTIGAALLHH